MQNEADEPATLKDILRLLVLLLIVCVLGYESYRGDQIDIYGIQGVLYDDEIMGRNP